MQFSLFVALQANPLHRLLLPPLVISISMAKGLAVGVKVCASSKAVIGERGANARYGAGWKSKQAYGTMYTRAGRFRAKPKMRNVQSSYSSNSIIAMPEFNF